MGTYFLPHILFPLSRGEQPWNGNFSLLLTFPQGRSDMRADVLGLRFPREEFLSLRSKNKTRQWNDKTQPLPSLSLLCCLSRELLKCARTGQAAQDRRFSSFILPEPCERPSYTPGSGWRLECMGFPTLRQTWEAHPGCRSSLHPPIQLLPNCLLKLLFWSSSDHMPSSAENHLEPNPSQEEHLSVIFQAFLLLVAGCAFTGTCTKVGHAIIISCCTDTFIQHVIYRSCISMLQSYKKDLF